MGYWQLQQQNKYYSPGSLWPLSLFFPSTPHTTHMFTRPPSSNRNTDRILSHLMSTHTLAKKKTGKTQHCYIWFIFQLSLDLLLMYFYFPKKYFLLDDVGSEENLSEEVFVYQAKTSQITLLVNVGRKRNSSHRGVSSLRWLLKVFFFIWFEFKSWKTSVMFP